MEKSKQLTVDDYNLEELQVTENAAYVGSNALLPQPAVDVDFSTFTHATDMSKFAVSLSVKSQEPISEDHPLRFSVRIVGFFTLAEPLTDGKLPLERAVNALTILYGMVRAYIGTTAAWFNTPLVMPTVYFTDLVNAKIASARQREIADSDQRLIQAAKTA